MVAQKYHTPFCEKNCKIEHHDLVTVLCLDSSQRSDELPDLLRECIDSYKNWDHNGEIPDPLEELRCPLIYLASAFGKAGLVRALLQDNFDARAVNFNGETALHAAVQYIFRTGTLKARGLKVASTLGPIKNRMKAFEQILVALTDSDPKIMFVQDNDGNTVFHAAADNIWNDRQNDRLGRSASFFQFCLKSLITRVLKLEEASKVTREEVVQVLNAENSDGDSIFHVLARDYVYGFKSMKHVLKIFFPGRVPSAVNKENETVAKIALERNRRKAIQVFPEFLQQEQSGSSISISSDSASSESELASPSTSKYSEESTTLNESTAHQEVPLIVISDNDIPQVTHSIEEDENSSSDVIANSMETVTASTDREQMNLAPLMSNPGTHDLLTVSIDSSQEKSSQLEVPSFLTISQKPNVAGSPYDSMIAAPVQAEFMYVGDTVCSNERDVSKETSVTNRCNGEDQPGASSKLVEVLDTDTDMEATANGQSDPLAPFSITFSSSDSNAVPQGSDQEGAPPSEERISCEERDSLEEDQVAVTDSTAEASNNNSDGLLGVSTETETSFNMETLNNVLGAGANKTAEAPHAQVPQTLSASQVGANEERDVTGIPGGVLSVQQSDLFEVPQANQLHRGKAMDSSLRGKTICGSIPSDLFDPPKKQIPESGDYGQLYACHLLDSPNLALQYKEKTAYENTREATSLTSLASASTETIHSETSDRSDLNTEGSDERSTILKCITDNSFLEFLITEGLELDSCSKKGVVDVVMSQYSNKLSVVENAIPTLAAQIKKTETTIGQQKEKVKQLQEELEFVKGEIVKNENLLLSFNNEQQGLSKQRKALKRKVARCEGTMKKLLVNAKKSRCD